MQAVSRVALGAPRLMVLGKISDYSGVPLRIATQDFMAALTIMGL